MPLIFIPAEVLGSFLLAFALAIAALTEVCFRDGESGVKSPKD